ncbi:retrovirus-related pol polyprotein from transposon TNT 1-94 [Tanacetum coccineum]
MPTQNSEYFKDKMLLMQAQENGVALDEEEQLLFIAGGQDNVVDEDVDEQPVQDLALKWKYLGLSMKSVSVYDSDILSEVPRMITSGCYCEHHKVQRVHVDVQPKLNVVESHADYTDLIKMKVEALKEQTPASRPIKGVNSCTDASGSQSRSNTKKNSILPAKSVNKKKVKEHPRTNKSRLKTMNRIDSSISFQRTVVQIVLWYLDSGCSKHMIGDRSRLKNFMKKFIGTVRFENNHFGAIMGYGDYVISDSVISRVYYVEGLGHNLFSVRQFCDSDLEVAFRKHSCYVRDTDGIELIKGSRGSNLYTILVEDMMKSSPICLLSKASKNKSWLWHRRLNHLNFDTINNLARKDFVRGLPRLKFEKDHLCSACQLGKIKKHTHTPKAENTDLEVFNTLHMDLCEPMRVQTINGKKYILVIVDDYSRFTWVQFLRSKDETPEAEAVATAFFGALCYPTNDSEDLGKLQPTADIGIFVGYAPSRKGYRIYNKRT